MNHAMSSDDIDEDRTMPLIYRLRVRTALVDTRPVSIKTEHQPKESSTIVEELFSQCSNSATIRDSRRVVVHNHSNCSTEVCGRREYSSGTHQCRLKIESNAIGTWIFFGIISKSTSMNAQSYNSPSAYGWADYDDFFLAGVRQQETRSGQFFHTKEGDIIRLVFDRDRRTVSYTNERTETTQVLDIDIDKCPFPWQLHVNLF